MMVGIKDKYQGKKMRGGTYIKPEWDEMYTSGRSGEDPMEYDYARTISVAYNWRGLALGERDWRG